MRKFQFRLQTALDFRRRKEEQLRTELAQIRHRYQQEVNRLEQMRREQESCFQQAASMRIGRLNPEESCAMENHLERLEMEIADQQNMLDLIQQEIEKKIEEVVAATQETKALEKLRERHAEEYRAEQLREEQKFLDEIASTSSARKMRAA